MKSLLSSIFLLILVLVSSHSYGQCGPGEDTTPPICSQLDATLYLDGAGMASVLPESLDGGSTDNCPGPLTFSLDQSSFDCTEVGANIVPFTVTDASGNTSSCDVIITVLDTIAPVCVSGTAVVTLFVDIDQVVNGEFVDEGSTDNCEIDTFIISPDTFGCDDVGFNPVTFTAIDVNGNSCTSVGEVEVRERIKPTCIVKDITVTLDGAGLASIVPSDVDDGTFDACGVIDFYSVTPNSFDCSNLGTNIVTFVAQDTSDNFCSTTANVFVRQPMTCSVNNPTAYFNDSGVATIQVSDVDNGSSLICGGTLNLSLDQFVFNCQASFSSPTTVYLIHNDGSGILDSCASQVTLLDTLAPVCEAPYEVTIYLDNAGMATAPTFDKDVVGSDNCELSTAVLSKTAYTCMDIGLNNETILLTDVYGNTNNCPALITVLDTIVPVCDVVDLTIYLDGSGMAMIDSASIDNNSTDICGITSLDLSQSSFSCDDVGTANVIVTVTDAGGNTSSCTSMVTVNDTIVPICSVLDITVFVDGSGMVSIDSSDVDNNSSDNCSDIMLSLDQTDFDCDDLGPNTVTITVTDESNNISTCQSVVTVLDTINPICSVQDVTVYVDGSGNAAITALNIDQNSTDNCANVSLAIDSSSFDCDNVNLNNPVVLTVSDNSGNTTSCESNVMVLDTIAPICQTNDITIYLDNSGSASITANDVNNNSSDNCSVQSIAIDKEDFNCDDLGANSVILTVTDIHANTSSCAANVTVLDTISPICNVMDITVFLDNMGTAFVDSMDVDNSSSDNCTIASLDLSSSTFNCTDIPSEIITITVTDQSGNTSSCSANITIQDTLAPICITQDITVFVASNGMVDITASDVDNGSNDNCGNVSLALDETNFDCDELGSNTVILTVTDDSSNSSTCTAEVTVLDTIAPICNAMDITVDLNAMGMIMITSADINNGSSDNCNVASVTLSEDSFDCTNIGSNAVTLTVTDDSGNSSSCVANVTIEDNLDVICMVQDITVYLDGNGMVSIDSMDVDNGSSDNCGSLTLDLDITDFDCSDIGNNTVTVTVTDMNGNSQTCEAIVQVQDTLAPNCAVQNLTVYLDGAGNASIDSSSIDAGSFDNCVDFTLDLSQESFDCTETGNNIVTVTTTDAEGNVSTCESMINVLDTIAPDCSAQNISVFLDSDGMISITATDIDAGSTDNCSNVNLSLDNTDFDCSHVGPNTVVLTVSDDSGNSSSCNATVTVLDTMSVICMVQDISVYLDAAGMASIDSSDVDNGSSDNCDDYTLDLDITSFSCDDIGMNTVIATVTDANGNSSTCSLIATVTDTLAPICSVNDLTIYLDGAGNVSIDSSDVDNGSSDNCIYFNLDLDITDFDCSSIGANTVVITTTDSNGNVSTCTSAVMVLDTIAPTCITQDITVQLDANGMVSITSSDVDNGSTDTCVPVDLSLDQTDFDCSQVGTNTVILTVTDANNNSSSCTANVTVQDTLSVSCSVQDITVYLDGTGMASIDSSLVDNGSSDNCSNYSLALDITDFNCDNIGSNTVVATVTDDNGNVSTCSLVATVLDTISPICNVMDLTVYLDGTGMTSIDSSDIDVNSSDNCPNWELDLIPKDFTCSNVGVNTIVVTVTDASGNVSTCQSEVTVLDTIAPICNAQDITIQLDAGGNISITAADIENGSIDICVPVDLSIDQSDFDCTQVGANTVILTVTDANNNTSTCSATVTVQDTMPVNCMVQDVTLYLDGTGMVSIDSMTVDNGSADNCSAFTLDLDTSDFNCNDTGMNTVIATVTDSNGNVSTCSLVATVLDTISPICNVMDITVYLDGSGMTSIDSSDLDVSSSDNCPDWVLDLAESDFDCSNVGANNVLVTITDASGNTSTCTSIVTVIDSIAPSCSTQDITIQLDVNGMASISIADIDNGSIDVCVPVDLSLDQTEFDCTQVGDNTVILTVTDGNNNSSTCTATVTVQDTAAVNCMVQDVTLYLDGTGMVSIDSSLVDNGSTDNCLSYSLELDATDFDCSNVGSNTVIATVTDANGNISTCSLIATVLDTLSPVCSVMDLTIYLDGTGMSSIDSSDLDVSSSDNCPDWMMDLSQVDFNCSNVGPNSVLVTITDASGNTSNCTSTVTVVDSIAPSCSTQDITIQLDGNGSASISISDIDNGSVDVCVPVDLSLDQTEFDCSQVGDNTVILTVTDANNNISTCSAIVTVQDTATVNCMVQDVTIYLDGSGMVSIDSSLVDNGSSDNCLAYTLDLDITDFDCANVGANTVVATLTDANGNISSCNLTATVLDTISPICDVLDLTIYLDTAGMVSIDSSDIDMASSDNCPGLNLDLSQEDFDCDNLGLNTVIVTTTDANGNITTCESEIMIIDSLAPICITQDITIHLDANGTASITTADIDNGSSDNCDPINLELDITDFDCSLVGNNTVTLTVTDGSSNSSQCTANVMVLDSVDVMCMVQDVTIYLDGTGMVSIDSSLVDNGSSDNCIDYTLDLDVSIFSCSDVGDNTVVATVTDANGNESTCTLTASVLDTISPICAVQDITVYLDANGEISIDSSSIDVSSSDNCPGWTLSLDNQDFDCTNIGANTVMVSVQDVNNNSSTCSSTVTVLDSLAPICITQDITIQLDDNGNASIVIADIDNGSSDNCGPVELAIDQEDFDCTQVGNNTVTLTVTDVNGNTSQCTSNVLVEDNDFVICKVKDISIYLDEVGMITIDSSDVDNGTTDNCGTFTMDLDLTNFSCEDIGPNTVTVTVEDSNGNISSCMLTATVFDTLSPICDVQDITVFLDGNGMISIDSSFIDVNSSDNCGSFTLELSDTDFNCEDIGIKTVVVTTTDDEGNESTCESFVTVLDSMRPLCLVQDVTVYLDDAGTATIDSSDVDNGSSDNCGGITLDLSPSNFNCEDIGPNLVTVTTTDDNGNTSTCLSTVVVVDSVQAECNVMDITIYLDENGVAVIDSSDVDNGTLDNCVDYTMDLDITNFDCEDIGSNTVNVTIEDSNGNISQCMLEVTVLDTIAPICSVQDISVYFDSNGTVSIDSSSVDNGTTDNCSAFILGLSQTNFNCSEVGINTITITTTDNYGNSSSCESMVTVLDTIDPICLVQDVTIYLDDQGLMTIDSSIIDNGSSDNCDEFTLELGQTDFDCDDLGQVNVSVTLTDKNGNVTICESQVSVLDTTTAECNAMDLIIYLDDNGEASIDSAAIDAGSMDNCSSYTLDLDISDFTCDEIGSNIVTVTTTDGSGNQSSCEAEVMVQDTTRPICMVQDITVYLDENGEIEVAVDEVDNGSSDNCSLLATLLSQQNFDCEDIGPNDLQVALIDHSGNENSCPVMITVLDTLVPICVFNNPTITLDENGSATIDSSDVDGGSSDNCGSYTIDISPDEFSCADIGTNTVSVTITDANGNSKVGMITVTVEGIPTPQIECPSDTTIFCTADITDLSIYGDANVVASCGGTIQISVSAEEDLNECGIGTITRRFIATETGVVAGVDTCYQIITIINVDTLTASVIDFPQDITIYNCSADLDLTGMVIIDDSNLNCNNISIEHQDDTLQTICPIMIDRSFTVVDSCNVNNGSYQTFEFVQNIIVQDTMAPVLTCPMDMTLDAPMDACEIEVIVIASAVDNCSNSTITNDSPFALDNGADATGIYPIGTTEVTFTAADTCGNSVSCMVNITVESTMPLTCDLGDLILKFPTSNVDEMITIDSSDLDLSINSCFDVVSISLSQTEFLCNDSSSEITVTILNANGETTTCSANVFIESSCLNFNNEEATGLMVNGTMGIANVLDIWDTQCASLQYSEGGNGLSQDSVFLHVLDEACGSSSVIFTDQEFNGNLAVSGVDAVICYDLAILNGDNGTGQGIATFMIYAGADPLNPDYSAIFVPSSNQVAADGYVQYCAPITSSIGGMLPSNSYGEWEMIEGTGSPAWDSLIMNVSGIAFDIDEIPSVDEYAIDNICLRNLTPGSPVITCPADLEILCSEIEETEYGTVDIGINCMMEYYIDTLIVSNIDVCNTGEMMRTYTVVDELGNSISCTQTVILNPPTQDYLDAPEEIVILLDGSQCNDTIMLPPAIINKYACGTAIDIITSINGLDMIGNGGIIDLPAGIFPLVYSAIDECGNTSTVQTLVKLLRPCDLSVHASLNVSLDESCEGDITPEMLATFPVVCGDYYTVTLVDENGNPIPGNVVTKDHVGTQISFQLSEPNCGNAAFGVLNIEDKYPPVLTCTSDTIMCGEPVIFPDPIITEFCDGVEYEILDETVESTDCTDPNIETIYTRTIQATDASGNKSEICTQTLSVRKFSVDSIMAPELFSIEIECNSAFPMDDEGNPDPEYYGGPLANGFDIYANQTMNCNVIAVYDDMILELPLETAVVRTWTVFYWSCTIDTSMQFIQLFKYIDSQGPQITCPSNITVAANADECSADLFLPTALVSDLCSSVDHIDLDYAGGFVENGNGAGVNLAMGMNEITYTAYDVLGNSSSCSFYVVVEDQDVPIAICEQYTTVPLPVEGYVDVDAFVFDDGSHDFCGIEKFEVRRMDPICDSDDVNFGESIRVCCEDLGTEVMVVMRVTDQSGNTNECMVFVEVQDKLAPQLLADLPDITVSCEFPIPSDNLSIFGTVVDKVEDRDTIILTGEYIEFSGEPLDALVLDNCITIINDEISETELNACGLGYAMRSITIEDGEGNSLTLDQRIDRINVSPFTENDITWPSNYNTSNICSGDDLDPEDLPLENGYPILANTLCDQVGYTYDDSLIDFSEGDEACFKIIRDWEVVNWCNEVGGTFEKFYFQQVIEVSNTIAPEITETCENIVQCSFDPNCNPVYIELINQATDDCTDSSNLIWNYYIDIDSDNSIDETGNSNNASGVYPVGTHIIMWSVSDQCGNSTACSYSFEIQNCKLPTAYCLDNITADLTPMDLDNDGEIDTEMLFLQPYMIDAGSSQTCNQNVLLSFSSDVNDTIRTYDCDDIGEQMVALWVTDENGNQSYCTTSIEVQDNNDVDFCASQIQVEVVGTIMDAKDVMMESVMLELNQIEGETTDEFGFYAFPELLVDEMYTIEPTKEDDAINGVSTLDIVLIQKHLLGIELFTNPYQHLAADVNQSQQISGADLIQIRRLLLGEYDEFPDTEPWRFYMNENGFIDESNPWANDLHEMYDDMIESDMVIDFTGVKMGDVNYTADVNGLMNEELILRSAEKLYLSEQAFNLGETKLVEVVLGQAQNVHGFQLEIEADDHISFMDIVEVESDQNIDFRILENGKRLRVLGYYPNTRRVDDETPLFLIRVKALKEVSDLADHMGVSENARVRNELYKADLSIHDVLLESRKEDEVDELLATNFTVDQNQPNPWKEETLIQVFAPSDGDATLRIIDMSGKVMYERKVSITEGNNDIKLSNDDIQATGVLYYSVEWKGVTIMKKMLILE